MANGLNADLLRSVACSASRAVNVADTFYPFRWSSILRFAVDRFYGASLSILFFFFLFFSLA